MDNVVDSFILVFVLFVDVIMLNLYEVVRMLDFDVVVDELVMVD